MTPVPNRSPDERAADYLPFGSQPKTGISTWGDGLDGPQDGYPRPRETTVDTTTRGGDLIAAERQRQITAEGWTLEHDREHGAGALAAAGYYYETHGHGSVWPWDSGLSAKVKGPLRNLVRAGALYQAAADIAPEHGHWNRASYERRRDEVAVQIDALIAEVQASS